MSAALALTSASTKDNHADGQTLRLTPGPMLPEIPNPTLRRWRRRFVWLTSLVFISTFLVLVHRPLLIGFANQFRVDNPAPSDVMVILLGGPSHRPMRAAELYRQGIAPLILMGDAPWIPELDMSEPEMNRQILARHGVPDSAIRVLRPYVTSTKDEADRVRDYLRDHPSVRRITVVTTAFHSARARWIFRRVLRGMDVDVRVASARQPHFDESTWYTHDEGLVNYFSEVIKTIYYRLVY